MTSTSVNSKGSIPADLRADPNAAVFNVKNYGAKGDGNQDDTLAVMSAIQAALLSHGTVYFPKGIYNASLSLTDVQGLTLQGDGAQWPNAMPGPISQIRSASPVVLSVKGSSQGKAGGIVIRDLEFRNTVSGGSAIQFSNVTYFEINRATGIGTVSLQGSRDGKLVNVSFYGFPALAIGNGDEKLTDSESILIAEGKFAAQSGYAANARTEPAIGISGNPTDIVFNNVYYESQGAQAAAVMLDGPSSGTPAGNVEFYNIHAESNSSISNLSADFLVGAKRKWGRIAIDGGNAWGHGQSDPGLHHQQDFIKIVAAKSVVVKNVITSNLSHAYGYDRSMIRLESTFPSTGDTYVFEKNRAYIKGSLYSDAKGILTTTTDAHFGEDPGPAPTPPPAIHLADESNPATSGIHVVNVKTKGAVGDAQHDDTAAIASAIDEAYATGAAVYLPTGRYRATVRITDLSGLTMIGDGPGLTAILNATDQPVFDVYGTGQSSGSGRIRAITLKNFSVQNYGSGIGMQLYNLLQFQLVNISAYSTLTAGLNVQGTGIGSVITSAFMGQPGMSCGNLSDQGGLLTNSGPLLFDGSNFRSVNTSPAIRIYGDALGVTFNHGQYTAAGLQSNTVSGYANPNAPIGAVQYQDLPGAL